MNLLGAVLYDPGTAATASTASLLAMTAIDTTNLRHTFTVPSHGNVLVRMRGVIHGGTGVPQVLLGVMDGATVRGRVAPVKSTDGAIAAAGLVVIEAEFTVSGLTPGSVTWDAAYGVETATASSAIKYGGPNNTTGNDAFGGFVFEVWDPQPQTTTGQLSVDANGRVDVIKVAGTTQTAGDIAARLPAALSANGNIQADIEEVNGTVVTGSGTASDPWGP